MNELSGSVRVEPETLESMASSIETHATRVEQRIQKTTAALESLIQGGGFEGIGARVLLWHYQQQYPTLLMWAKRLRAYALRLRNASKVIKLADVANVTPDHPHADSFARLHGIARDHGYQKLLDFELKLKGSKSERDTIAISLMSNKMRLAELQAQLADYDEVSGSNLGNYAEDMREYFDVRLSGHREQLEREIVDLQTSIGSYETNLAQVDENVRQITLDIDTASAGIQNRVQDVGGHEVLFYQQMSARPIAEAGWCLKFVTDWRPDINTGFGSAANLITTNDGSVAPFRYRIDATTSLPERMVPGDLVVWNRGQQAADTQHGHVAIIMEVHDYFVIVKESSWDNTVDTWREIPRSKLQDLTFVGQPPQ